MFPELLDEVRDFQDRLEDATARAPLLPSWLAYPLLLRPVQQLREGITAKLARCVEEQWAGRRRTGIWTAAMQGMLVGDSPLTAGQAAELLVGFLFAAHKNPAIGAGQTLLMLLEHPEHLAAAQGEARARTVGGAGHDVACPILAACITETLRLCAHTIGAVRKVVAPGGYTIRLGSGDTYWVPQGAYIAASHSVPHMQEELYPSAAIYDPARFLPGGAAVDAGEYTMTTFSHGLHRCPGRHMAMLLMRDLLACVLREYTVEAKLPIPPLDFKRATLGQRRSPAIVHFCRTAEANQA